MWNCWQELNFRVTEYIPLLARVPKVSRWRLEKCRYRDHNVFHNFIVEMFFWNCQTSVSFNTARILFMEKFKNHINIYKGLSMSNHFVHNLLNMRFYSFFRTINTSISLVCQIKFKLVHEHSLTVYLLDIQGSVVHV